MNKEKKTIKAFVEVLNECSPESDSESWIIGGKNRYCGRNNYGVMLKRYDPIAFKVAYDEWCKQ